MNRICTKASFGGYAESVRQCQPRAAPLGFDQRFHLAVTLTVKATLYYQSIPPYYLNDRFREAPNEPATRRLYYLTSNLQTKGTAIENWKLRIATASNSIGD